MIYRSKMHRVLTRNFDVFSVLDWFAAITAHIPNQGEHLVRYYGWHSNVSLGKRKQAEEPAPTRIARRPGRDSPTAGLVSVQAALGRVDQESV